MKKKELLLLLEKFDDEADVYLVDSYLKRAYELKGVEPAISGYEYSRANIEFSSYEFYENQ